MARSYTVDEIRLRIRRQADIVNSDFVSDAELLDYINNSYGRLYQLLTDLDEDYFSATSTITLVPGTTSYSLPATLYKVQAIELLTAGQYVTLRSFEEHERNHGTVSTNIPAATVRVRHVPEPAKFTAGSDTINGRAGWEEFVVIDGAIQCKMKEESDTNALERRFMALKREITEAAKNRDMLWSGRTTDIYAINNTGSSLRYKIYGDTIEFINAEAIVPMDWY